MKFILGLACAFKAHSSCILLAMALVVGPLARGFSSPRLGRDGQGGIKTMGLDSRLGFHACYATLAMLIYMLPHVRPMEMLL